MQHRFEGRPRPLASVYDRTPDHVGDGSYVCSAFVASCVFRPCFFPSLFFCCYFFCGPPYRIFRRCDLHFVCGSDDSVFCCNSLCLCVKTQVLPVVKSIDFRFCLNQLSICKFCSWNLSLLNADSCLPFKRCPLDYHVLGFLSKQYYYSFLYQLQPLRLVYVNLCLIFLTDFRFVNFFRESLC